MTREEHAVLAVILRESKEIGGEAVVVRLCA